MSYHRTPPYLYVHQPDVTINQANPVSGTEYQVLAATPNVRLISIHVKVTWTAQPTPLEAHVTIDGQTHNYTVANPVSATGYFARISEDGIPGDQPLSTTDSTFDGGRPFLLEGRNIRVTVETTGGTVSNITARVKFARIM